MGAHNQSKRRSHHSPDEGLHGYEEFIMLVLRITSVITLQE